MNALSSLSSHDIKWCLRRVPQPVVTALKLRPRRACIAGGFIRANVAGEPVNDIDLFAENKTEAFTLASFLAANASFKHENRPDGMIHTTDNAYTIRGYPITPQVIHRWSFPDVLQLLESFDFTIARAALFWDGSAWQGVCDAQFYPDLAAKRLVYCAPKRDEEPGGSMLRVLKFYQRGYRIPLDSLASVMARCAHGIQGDEFDFAQTLLGRLVAVDPAIDPTHEAHLPSTTETQIQ